VRKSKPDGEADEDGCPSCDRARLERDPVEIRRSG